MTLVPQTTRQDMIGAIILLLQGHALTRKLDCGKVNTMQTLQNLNEGSTVLVPTVTCTHIIVCQAISDATFSSLADELAGFEESWQKNAGECLPGWDPRVNRLSSGTPPFFVTMHMICWCTMRLSLFVSWV
jgi:hypothetical protein